MADKHEPWTETGLEIAVVGLAGRFPGSSHVRAFWDNLRQGVESVTFFTEEELIAAGVDREAVSSPNYVKAKSRLQDVESFDSDFFEYAPREAEMLDPQFRIFHECVWEALEDAGYDPDNTDHLIGLYAGASNNLYWLARHLDPSKSPSERFQALHLNDPSFATRISYKLNLKGPSVSVQTACSTSLVAIHFACQGLLSGECDVALAGGVSINLPHTEGYLYQEGMIFSPDGHCRAFDEEASGTIFGDGAGVVVLKRLQDAVRDGDHIYAVVKGSAINNDGHDKVGYTAPSTSGQAEVIRYAHKMAEVEADTITYIEAHGTGTALGDPIEIEALTQAFDTGEKGFCRIGTVKSNIGHLDAAAGVAGFIKTVLALHEKQIPPTLHVTRPNPKIDFANTPFLVNTELTPWERRNAPRRAGVSAFGIGGTNAHIVLEEAPPVPAPPASERRHQLFVLSAKTEAALERATDNLQRFLEAEQAENLADVAYTLQTGRKRFKHRRVVAASTREELIERLAARDEQRMATLESEGTGMEPVFLFSGQGSQYVNMGRDLYETEPVFRKAIDDALTRLRPHMTADLKNILFPAPGLEAEMAARIGQTDVTQPLLFLFEYALAQLLLSLGIRPKAMIGHSIGEYVAACLAGVFTLDDALRLVALRGRLMQEMETGAMWSVPLGEDELQALLPSDLSIAAVNAPQMCVVAGPEAAAHSFADRLAAEGHKVRRLHVSHAFHSPMMAPMVERFVQEVRAVRLSAPETPYLSNVSGTWITAGEATDPAYWGKHLLGTVRFADGMKELLNDRRALFVEVGPGNALSTFARKLAEGKPTLPVVSLVRHPQETVADSVYFVERIGRMWMHGLKLDWLSLHGTDERRKVTLPTYPFERRKFPVDGGLPLVLPSGRETAAGKKTARARKDKGDKSATPLHVIERQIAQLTEEHFGFQEVRVTDNFFEFGASSLDVLTLSQKIGEKFGREIPSTTFFTHTTIRSVARWLHENGVSPLEEEEPGFELGDHDMEIAVIGMAGRFPGASNLNEYWENLKNGVETISFFTDEELAEAGVDANLLQHPQYVKAKGALKGVEWFDAAFFDYSPREAERMDPQFRLFHECSWEALETAGYDPDRSPGKIGVYAGTSPNYEWVMQLGGQSGTEQFSSMLLNDREFFATMLAYKFNLNGPAVTMQTACSTSLVNIILACQGLVTGSCDMALAGGATVSVPQKNGYLYQDGMINSSDGHCRVFDAKADGTVFGDGVGVVVLKRLQDAQRDGDNILAVIKGVGLNNDGNRKVGFTAPSTAGQADAVRQAMRMAGVKPTDITYIEAHGTGTNMGDPIELEALKTVFRTEEQGFCRIGSVKSNVGHLNAAAGIAGFIKTILAMQHKQLPPTLHVETPNPKLGIEGSPFVLNTELTPWHSENTPLRAGVSSFGIGGTNAHVIVEEAASRESEQPRTGREQQLLVLSARTETALAEASRQLADHLEANPHVPLADVAYTLQVGRKPFEYRKALVAATSAEAQAILRDEHSALAQTDVAGEGARPLVLMFSGQGSQYVNMGRDLYLTEAVFRDELDLSLEFVQAEFGLNLREVLFPSPESDPEAAAELLKRTDLTQPVLFIFEYALAQQLLEWGLQPTAMIGHSIGEYAAACLAGVMTREEALRLVVMRGRLMQAMPPGAMLSVPLAEADLLPYLNDDLSLAAINSQSLCVVSGPQDAVDALATRLQADGHATRALHTSHAFHSHMMEPMLAEFEAAVREVELRAPQIPYLSNVSGTWITPEQATDPNYYARHLRHAVRFADGIAELLRDGNPLFLEAGPGNALTTFVRKAAGPEQDVLALNLVRHPQEEASDSVFLLQKIGRVFAAGVEIDWAGFHGEARLSRVPLPTYPFERERYWPEMSGDPRAALMRSGLQQKRPLIEWFYLPTWERALLPERKAEPVKENGCWLIFQDASPFGEQLIERLAGSVIRVGIGSKFAANGEGGYVLNPALRSDYDALCADLKRRGLVPERILHLWNVTGEEPIAADSSWIDESQKRGYYSLLFLAQGLSKQGFSEEISLTVLTNDMQDVLGTEPVNSEKATLLGPVKVIPQEYGRIGCRNIDVTLPQRGSVQERKLLDRVHAELLVADKEEPVVAYRGNYRYVQTYKPTTVKPADGAPPILRQEGVYLITGGLGGIGLVLAEYLAKTVQAKLVLTGRTPMPARDEWDAYLVSADESDGIAAKIRKVRHLESLGSEILLVRADIADEAQMQRLFEQIDERFGTLNGVAQAAGLPGSTSFRSIHDIDGANEEQFRSKVYGLNVLARLLEGRDLDFCLLFSSLASVLGGLGFSGYSAANLYMDAFVQRHNRTSDVQWTCANWDAWQFWEAHTSTLGESLATLAILPEEGGDLFQHVFSTGLAHQLIVSTGDLGARVDQWVKRGGAGATAEPRRKGPAAKRKNMPQPYVPPKNDLERTLAEIWQDFLGIEQVGTQDNFFDLGASSLDIIQVTDRINAALSGNIPVVSLFTYPSVAALAAHIGEGQEEDGAEDAEEQLVTVSKGKQRLRNQRDKRRKGD